MANGEAGRPTKKTPEMIEKILKELKDGLYFKYACKINGITEETGINWKNDDPVFSSQVEAARMIGIKRLQMAAVAQGAAWKVLKNVARGDFTDEEYSEHKILMIKQEIVSKLSTDELIAENERLTRLIKGEQKQLPEVIDGQSSSE